MIRLDHEMLQQVGLGSLPAEASQDLLRTLHEALNVGVGARLSGLMSTKHLDAFESAMSAGDDERCLAVMTEAVPHYQLLVAAEVEILRRWLRSHYRAVLAVCWELPPGAG